MVVYQRANWGEVSVIFISSALHMGLSIISSSVEIAGCWRCQPSLNRSRVQDSGVQESECFKATLFIFIFYLGTLPIHISYL